VAFQYLKGPTRKLERDFLQGRVVTGQRGNGFKLKEGRFRLDIRKKFFTTRVVRHWQRLPREAAAAPSLAVLKARLDGALNSLVWWKVFLPMADLYGPFQPKPFYDLMILSYIACFSTPVSTRSSHYHTLK